MSAVFHGLIYKITNNINGKIYIGQTTKEMNFRWSQHCYIHPSKNGSPLNKAINKYGRDSFTIEQIGGANSLAELNYQETLLIYTNNSLVPVGYNVKIGGRTGPLTKEHKKKISDAHKGRPLSKKHVAALQKAWDDRAGFTHSEETKRKMSKTHKGVVHTSECREKLSKALMGRVNTWGERKAVRCIETGVEYRSIKGCAREMGLAATSVARAAKGVLKTTGGYTFEFVLSAT